MPRGLHLQHGHLRLVQVAAEALAVVLLIAALAGCGGGPRENPSSAGPRIGVPLRLATCADWRKADPQERLGTVRGLRKFAGGAAGSPPVHGRVLKDDDAYELFQSYCANAFASAFKLYKLYTRAASFSGPRGP